MALHQEAKFHPKFVTKINTLFFIVVWLVSSSSQTRPVQAEVHPNLGVSPSHGIHAPVGFRWTDADRAILGAFHNASGRSGAPGLVVALSVDMTAANNSPHVLMERDLYAYQTQGATVLVRMWPQRFPGGSRDKFDAARGVVSGVPDDAAADIMQFLTEQQARQGWHFTNIIPGNEMNIEWPNALYNQNLLPWASNDDPIKYRAINQFMLDLYAAWQVRVSQPEGRRFQDVNLFFPAIAQDGAVPYFGGFYFYADAKPAGNKYDLLRPAIETFGHFSWHNYWRPSHAWEDRAIANFPDWLKQALLNKQLPGFITESGWSPQAMRIEAPDPVFSLWRNLAPTWWQAPAGGRSWFTHTQDDAIGGRLFEDDLQYFIERCSGAAYDQPASAQGVAVWLAASNSGFPEAAGLWSDQAPSRWLRNYAAWNR